MTLASLYKLLLEEQHLLLLLQHLHDVLKYSIKLSTLSEPTFQFIYKMYIHEEIQSTFTAGKFIIASSVLTAPKGATPVN